MAFHNFIPGTYAEAEQVNDNFSYLLSLIGEDATPDTAVTNGGFRIGPRRSALLSAVQDTGGASTNFVQLTWNADYTKANNVWSYSRILPNGNATAIRLGANGLSVYTTGATTGNLDSQLKNVFHLSPHATNPNAGYIAVPWEWSFQHHDGTARNIQDYRLTYVPMATPPSIYTSAQLTAGIRVLKATDYGVPQHAKAISIFAYVTAANGSGAGFKMFEERLNRDHRFGFTVHAALGGSTGQIGQRAGGWGVVPLGVDTYQAKFCVETTARIELANVYLSGYWI